MSLPPPDLPSPPEKSPATHTPPKPDISEPVRPQPKKPEIEAELPSWGFAMLRDAISYPWRRGGYFILVPGVFLALAFAISSWAPVMGVASTLIGVGYFSAFYLKIIETTFSGRHYLPDWPEFSDFYGDLIQPGLQLLGIFLLCRAMTYLLFEIAFSLGIGEASNSYLEAFLFWVLLSPHMISELNDLEAGWLQGLDIAVFWLYFPMAVLGVVLHGGLGGALPHRVLPAIWRCSPAYLFGVAAMLLVYFAIGLLQSLLGMIPYLGVLLVWLLSLCLLVMQARITACFGVHHANRILSGGK